MRFSSRQRLSERAERMVADRLLQRFLESKTMCADHVHDVCPLMSRGSIPPSQEHLEHQSCRRQSR